MKKLWLGGLALGALLVCLIMVAAQPPMGKDRGPGRDNGPPPGGPGGPPPPPPPPGRYVPGRLMPEAIRDELDLTDDQEKELTDLERDVKARLMKILTSEQKKKLDDLRHRGPGGPPPGGPGGPPPGGPGGPPPGEAGGPPPRGPGGAGRPPEREERPSRPERPERPPQE